MGLFLVVFVAMLLVMGIMAVGVLMGRKPIAGSCGGLSAIGMKSACEICGGDQDKCEKENQKAAAKAADDLAYDAMDAPKRDN